MRIPIGLVLIAVAWTLNWSLSGLRTHLLFFPLWLGFDSPRWPTLAEARNHLWRAEPDLVLVNHFGHGGASRILVPGPVIAPRFEKRYWIGPEHFPKLVLVYARPGSPRRDLSAPPGFVLKRVPETQ